MIEVDHQLLEIALAHLSVADADTGSGRVLHFAAIYRCLHFVVHEVHLSAATQLAQRRFAQRWPVPLDMNVLMASRSAGAW